MEGCIRNTARGTDGGSTVRTVGEQRERLADYGRVAGALQGVWEKRDRSRSGTKCCYQVVVNIKDGSLTKTIAETAYYMA